MFLNRKKFASLNVLIATDWNMNIVHCYAHWPGSACDITVWKSSVLCKALREDKESILPSINVEIYIMFRRMFHLIR